MLGNDVAGAILTVQVPADLLTTVASGHPAPSAVTPGLRAPGIGPAPLASTAVAAPTASAPTAPAASTTGAPAVTPRAFAQPNELAAPTTAATATTTAPGGVLRTVPIAGDGLFSVDNLPSPGVYDLVVTKPGFATVTQRIDLAGGESRAGVVLRLSTGDGLISGTVVGPAGPLGGAVVTATSGTTSVQTLSVTTKQDLGKFTLRGLISPASYTVTVSLDGYTTITSTLSLAADQQLTNVRVALSKAAGTLAGTVTTASDNKPAGGVSVTVTAGAQTVTTVTQSGAGAGKWAVDGLPIPGSYTITFSRSDLQSQTVAVAIDAAGSVSGTASASGAVDVAMRSSFATVHGTVRQETDTGVQPAGGASISLTSGTNTYAVTSASTPSASVGQYEIGGVVPGTYTMSVASRGTSPSTEIITVTAGQDLSQDVQLIKSASINGTVTQDGQPAVGYLVDLYVSTAYPNTVTETVATDSQGKYSFTDVDAPQAYVVSVRSPNSGPLATGTLALQPSTSGTLDFPLTSSSTTPTAATTTGPANAPGSATSETTTGTVAATGQTAQSATTTTPANSPASTTPTTCAVGQACPGGGGP